MAMILDLDRKYQILIVVFISIFLVLTISAITISNLKFEAKPEGSVAVILNDGDLTINYVDGNEISFNDNKEHEYGVTLTNSSDKTLFYSIGFQDSTDNAKVIVEDSDGNEINSMGSNLNTKKIINLFSLKGGETVRYVLKITSKKGAFKGTIVAVNESLTTQTFSDILLLNHPVVEPKTRIGSEISTVKEGLISTQDNLGTSYVFRGVVNDNYLKMGDYYFRVVRINGDESVRIVLDGVISNPVPYNTNTVEDETKFAELAILNKATAYTQLVNWFNENLKDYGSYLANGTFCTDTNFNRNVNDILYTASYERLFDDDAPDLVCNGTAYQGKIGLLSADEVTLAGAYRNVPNTKYYLYNENIEGNYLTTSSYYRNASGVIAMMNVINDGSLGEGVLITSPSYLRPVLSISVSTKVKGEGTYENPYIIVS